jgi:hypothetical protein
VEEEEMGAGAVTQVYQHLPLPPRDGRHPMELVRHEEQSIPLVKGVLQGCPVGLERLKIPPIERVVVSKQDIHGDQRVEVIVVGVGQAYV